MDSLPDTILVASSNPKKLTELQQLFAGLPLRVVGPPSALPEVIEDADTFEGNARKKATEIARHFGLATLADDSGLVVDALEGAPGVRSARFATDAGRFGELDRDEANNRLLLERMAGQDRRSARFRCVLVLAGSDGTVLLQTEGAVEGRILEAPRGQGGFGYDPLFQPVEEERSMAELSAEEKAGLSHRGRAARAMRRAILARRLPDHG